MESWREELYHSVEGSAWKDHKYIAIINGKYIYPGDVINGKNKSYANKTGSSVSGATSSMNASDNKSTKKKNFKVEKQGKKPVFKGFIADESHLPANPILNDAYCLANTNQYVRWNGSAWEPYTPTAAKKKAKKAAVQYVGTVKKKSKSTKDSGISSETAERVRKVLKKQPKRTVKLNPDSKAPSSSGSAGGGGR